MNDAQNIGGNESQPEQDSFAKTQVEDIIIAAKKLQMRYPDIPVDSLKHCWNGLLKWLKLKKGELKKFFNSIF